MTHWHDVCQEKKSLARSCSIQSAHTVPAKVSGATSGYTRAWDTVNEIAPLNLVGLVWFAGEW